jgi:protein-S-isoprenylcysteine O-methyltransferase Ste14
VDARTLLRHVFSIAVLPFTMAVIIPWWLTRRPPVLLFDGPLLPQLAVQVLGVVLLAIGLLLFVSSLRRFATEGQGTLAPWDPPRALVLHGPYRYVRNPMISGVIFILFGEALLLFSALHLSWAVIFLVLNMIYIPLLEEPQLEQRFGEPYREYRRHVRRFLPRTDPWQPAVGVSGGDTIGQ